MRQISLFVIDFALRCFCFCLSIKKNMQRLHQLVQKDLIQLLVKQAHQELEYSNVYLRFAYWFDSQAFTGIGKYFKAESETERQHSIQIYDYLNVRGVQFEVKASGVHSEQQVFDKPYDWIELHYQIENQNYARLDNIAKAALKYEDALTLKFLQKMLESQASSCDDAEKMLTKAKAYSQIPGLFYHLDEQIESKGQSFDTWK